LGIRLKIADNEAYTALVTLQRLGVPVTSVERADIWDFETGGTYQELMEAVKRNEALFNQNKHEMVQYMRPQPRRGEVWIQRTDERLDVRRLFTGKTAAGAQKVQRYTGWRLFHAAGEADAAMLQLAVERLLCNSAIERAIT
jgi:hypothetical protein